MPPLSKTEEITASIPSVSNVATDRMSIRTTQVFSRRSMGFLWDKRAEFDPGQAALLDKIYNNKKKGGIQAAQEVTYRLCGEKAGKLGYGRLISSSGFELLEKECRGTICRDFYHDIDIVNCHPVLLLQFVAKKGLSDRFPLPETKRYVEDREAYLAAVMEEDGVCREEAKKALIKIMYGGKANNYLATFSNEIRRLTGFLMGVPEYASLKDAIKHKDNKYGSFLAYLLQTEERKCMLALKAYLESINWSVDVLCYDGVMIRKRAGAVCDDALLIGCSDAIYNATGYGVKLISKEFSYFDIPAVIGEQVAKGVSLEAYQEMRAELEENYFYHEPTHQYVKVNELANLQFMVDGHARTVINHYFHFKHSDRFADYTGIFDIWSKDPKKRICDEVSFRASTNPRVFQLPINFVFWKATPPTEPTGALPLFLEIVKLMANDNEVLYNYILDWTAHLLQHPTDLPGVALVLTGSKGVGKDTFGDFLQDYVVGQHFSTNYNTNRQFFSTHDMGKINKFLVKMEETNKKDCFENASELKSAITATKITANPKGVKEITCENFARYIFTTNKPNPVDMSDRERRFVLCAVSDKRRGDREFWNGVRTKMFSPEGGYEVGMFLMERDISSFDVRTIPANDYQDAIIKSEETSETRWFNQWDGEKIGASEAYADYCNYCRDNNLKYAQDLIWFCKVMMSFVRDGKLLNLRPGNVSYFKKP